MKEIWKDVVGYEGLYQVSNRGMVRSIRNGIKTMGRYKNTSGYYQAGFCLKGKLKFFLISRLVAFAFIDNVYGKPQVNHKNGDKLDNRVENLEWVTQSENTKHAYDKLGVIHNHYRFPKKYRNFTHSNLGKKGFDNHSSKPVVQLGKYGSTIKVWGSISLAAETMGKSKSGIWRCCKGISKTAYGYKRKYL